MLLGHFIGLLVPLLGVPYIFKVTCYTDLKCSSGRNIAKGRRLNIIGYYQVFVHFIDDLIAV